jgi:hypothetical protein
MQMIRKILSRRGVTVFDSQNRTPAEVAKNQSSVPQLGHGASPGGRDGSMQIGLSQTGQWFGAPSGVRDETARGMAIFHLPRLAGQ